MNRGGAGVKIIVLALIILVAAVPWFFIISRNLGSVLSDEPEPAVTTPVIEETRVEDEPPPEPEPTPTPSPTPEVVHDIDAAQSETIISIKTEFPELFDELDEVSSEYDAVAASLVLYDGETGEFFTYEFGYADKEEKRAANTDTKFRVASLAKLTTVICAMVLVDEGLINLDTDISVYLGYEVKNTNFPGDAVTTRMLMQHMSSIFDSGAFDISRNRNTSESLRFLLERGSSFRRNRPGTNFEYTNFGYAILGAVCENVSGKTLDTYAREVLFEPLGIDAAYVPSKLNDTNNIAVLYNNGHEVTRSVRAQLEIEESDVLGHDLHLAQGNLTISVIDYARILAMLGNNGILNDVRILSPGSVQAIHVADVEGASYKQGLGTRLSDIDFLPGESFFWHNGFAYGLLSQYLHTAASGVNRGVVVVATGANPLGESNGMVSICSDMSAIAWRAFDIPREVIELVDEEE